MADRRTSKLLKKERESTVNIHDITTQISTEDSFVKEKRLKEVVKGILPISYEDEIVQRRTQILRDPLQSLLLFPEDDVAAHTIKRELRTERTTVPDNALSKATSLFTRECIRSYTTNWHCIENKYTAYAGSYCKLPRQCKAIGLQEQNFEIDLVDEVDNQQSDVLMSPLKEKGVTKQGYLTKASFLTENNGHILGPKTYKRRWFHLKQISSDGSYVLEYRKDDKNNSTARGVLYLDACTHISKGVKGRMYGFELHIQDKDYSLVADTQSEMDSWITVLCKVTGIDMDSSSCSSRTSFVSFPGIKGRTAKHVSLRESLKNSKHPELLEYAKETDVLNTKRRRESRHKLFSLVQDLDNSVVVNIDDARIDADVYKEHFGTRFIVTVDDLKFRLLTTELNGVESNVEPFFTSLALYDVKNGVKLTEDFHCDLNSMSIREMLQPMNEHITNGETNGDVEVNGDALHEIEFRYPKQALFSVTNVHSEVYLVAKIEKVLQGSISSSVDPYLKSAEAAKKTAGKVHKMAEMYCKKLGQYRMPFGWAARPVFTSDGTLEVNAEFTSIFRQEREKLGDEELIKLLSHYFFKNERFKQQPIPGSISVTLEKFSKSLPNCLTSSLVPVKPFSKHNKVPPILEIQEFNQACPEAAYPHTTYVNNLYVYPISLNYSNQKTFHKARNIAVTIEFRDTDSENAQAIKCIFSKNGTPSFTTKVTAAVVHHCTNPTFYEEVKIQLPAHLTERHHIFFTFHHVSCESTKSNSASGSAKGKPIPAETPVGYAWLPVLSNNRVLSDESNIPVASYAPHGYLTTQPAGMGKYTGPDIKWVDGAKSLFKINTKLVSTIYTQDPSVDNFFLHCERFDETPSADAEMTKLLKLLYAVEVSTITRFLPVIFNQLFHLLLVTESDDVSLYIARVLIRVVAVVHEANRLESLKSYVKYVFVTEKLPSSKKAVHEELAKYLMMSLRPGADPVHVSNLMKHSWFFFEILVKSMAQTLVKSDKIKRLNRESWFPESYHKALENFLQSFIPQIISRLKDLPQVAKDANFHFACFIKDCFTYMDRGFVFQMMSYYTEQFKDSDTQMLEFKFEFLQIVCNHEHYIALNLPLDVRALGSLNESELTDTFCQRYFLVGILLREVSSALTQGRHIRRLSIRVLRNLLVKHELDDRYDDLMKQSRIASLYLPFLTVLLEHAPRFHGSKQYVLSPSASHVSQASSAIMAPDLGSDSSRSSFYSRQSPNSSLTTSTAATIKEATQIALQVPFDEDETKELLLCFCYIIKNLEQGIILDWWRQIMNSVIKRAHWHPTVLFLVQQDKHYSKFAAIIDVFDLLELSLKNFQYRGKKEIESSSPNAELAKQYLENRYHGYTVQGSKPSHNRSLSNGGYSLNVQTRVLMEGNLANEIGLIVLDMVELFCNHFKFHLEQEEGDNILMKRIFGVLICLLQLPQSEVMMKHIFASLRSFINKFPVALFKGSATHCGDLCREILSCCNSKLTILRNQACAFLYLMMRSNFEYSGCQGCDRVHWQVIVAVSKLIASGLNRTAVNNSLVMLKNYAMEDKGMKNTSFPSEVKDLTKKIYTVLQATAQMKEYDDIPEMLLDLQYSLAKSYSSTPELRETWLEQMAAQHEAHGNFSETAHCYIHAAALVAEYLKRQGVYAEGCLAFKNVSPNVVPDESVMKTDEGMAADQKYSLRHLMDLLEQSAKYLEMAERYEVMGEVYKIVIPLYEQERDFRGLAHAYENLAKAYRKVVEVMASGKRLLGKYFRVAFFGRKFGDDDGKEYVYKEPKITSLSEISHRMETMYSKKYGSGTIKLILESSKVHGEDLDPEIGYIQITYVEPFFDEEELARRPTQFERNNNIRRFIYETPFTISGKAHGELTEQCKRKTILTSSNTFPYLKTRILVVQEEQYELTPVEVAIDQMQNKVKELQTVITANPPDMKKLQLKLQGSISATVNAGPLAFAQSFLDKEVAHQYTCVHIEKLQQVFRDFMTCCGKGLELNDQLIKEDQRMYQEDLKEKYTNMRLELAKYLNEELPPVSLTASSSMSSLVSGK